MFLRHKLCHKDASRLEGGGLRHLLWATMLSWHLFIGISVQFKLTQRLWFTA